MLDTQYTQQNHPLYRTLLLTWTASAGYFLLLCTILGMLLDSLIEFTSITFTGILALMIPLSTAFFSTFLVPRSLVSRLAKCCLFSLPTPSLLCVGSIFMIPYGIPNRGLYVFQVVSAGLLCSICGTTVGWIIRRRK